MLHFSLVVRLGRVTNFGAVNGCFLTNRPPDPRSAPDGRLRTYRSSGLPDGNAQRDRPDVSIPVAVCSQCSTLCGIITCRISRSATLPVGFVRGCGLNGYRLGSEFRTCAKLVSSEIFMNTGSVHSLMMPWCFTADVTIPEHGCGRAERGKEHAILLRRYRQAVVRVTSPLSMGFREAAV